MSYRFRAYRTKVDQRTDVFSFGVVLYEVLTGRRPFGGESVEAIIGRILTLEPEGVTVVKPDLPRDLGKLVGNCLQKSLKRRIQSMVDVRRELEDVKRGVEAGTVVIKTSAAARQAEPPPVPLWRRPVPLAAAVLLVVVGVLALYFTAERMRQPSEPPLRRFQLPLEAISPVNGPAISPDGRYVAYFSIESGQWEVYVRPFPKGGGKWQVSVNGGVYPRWKGNELFFVGNFVGNNSAVMAVRVETASGFQAGNPQLLFTGEQVNATLTSGFFNRYNVSADGQRFVVAQDVGERTPPVMTVVQNWAGEFDLTP